MSVCIKLTEFVSSFTAPYEPRGRTVYTITQERMIDAGLPSAYVLVGRDTLDVEGEDGTKRQVKRSYGIIAVLQFKYVYALKQHYPSTITR